MTIELANGPNAKVPVASRGFSSLETPGGLAAPLAGLGVSHSCRRRVAFVTPGHCVAVFVCAESHSNRFAFILTSHVASAWCCRAPIDDQCSALCLPVAAVCCLKTQLAAFTASKRVTASLSHSLPTCLALPSPRVPLLSVICYIVVSFHFLPIRVGLRAREPN